MSTETMQPFHPSFTIASNTNFHNNNAYYTAASETDPNNYLLETFHQYPHGDFRPTFYNPFEIKHRRRTSRAQLKVLEKSFSENPKPNATVRRILAQKLDMTPRGVQIWFQNRRAKAKLQRRKAAAASNNGEAKPEQQQQEKNESSTTGQQQQQQQSESIEQSVLFSQFFANVPAQHEQTGKPAFTSYMPPKTTQRPIHNNDCVYGWPQERADSVRSVATAAAAAAAAAAAYDPHTWLSVPVHPLGFDDMMTRRGSCPVTTTTDFSNPLELNWDPAFDVSFSLPRYLTSSLTPLCPMFR